VDRKTYYLIGLMAIILFSACASKPNSQISPSQPLIGDSIHIEKRPTATPIMIPRQVVISTPTPMHSPKPTPTPIPTPTHTPTAPVVPTTILGSGTGAAPYGQPPAMTAEEIQLTQQLFTVINSDRAARGLYPYRWNPVLAGGARLHSWNMVHCGFSHTCPDGHTFCQRISNEGFTNYTMCGECIAYAGPYPTPYGGAHAIQESMINEPPTGWHRIYLTSTVLTKVGVGVYVDSSGYIWFTEDFVS
jgi:uncharacterized protein YkwD